MGLWMCLDNTVMAYVYVSIIYHIIYHQRLFFEESSTVAIVLVSNYLFWKWECVIYQGYFLSMWLLWDMVIAFYRRWGVLYIIRGYFF